MYEHLVVGIEPGFATQGLAVIAPDSSIRSMASFFSKKKDWEGHKFEERLDAMINNIIGIVRSCANDTGHSRILFVLEEWRTNPRARNNVTSYQRGYYDAELKFRLRMEFLWSEIVTISPIWVSQFSNAATKFTKGKENPSAREILTYIQAAFSWLHNFEAERWLNLSPVYKLTPDSRDSSKSKKEQIHFADAAVMAVMGQLAINHVPALMANSPPRHRKIIEQMRGEIQAQNQSDTR